MAQAISELLSATCPPKAILRDYICGRISADQFEVVASHLASCSACLRQIEILDQSEAPLVQPRDSTVPPATDDPALDQAIRRLLSPVGFPSDSKANPLMPGDRLGEYKLLEQVGEGGMGTTYRARHVRLAKSVALKVLRPNLARDPAAVARFRREMRAIGRLQHPHIVQATDAGEARGFLYLVMEFLSGETLSQRVRKEGPLPIDQACCVVRSAARGLAHTHDLGLVHRDVKPSNLMQTADGQVKVLDLGLALLHVQPEDDSATHILDSSQLSDIRGVVGTNDYMAPEQWRCSSQVDARADQYSLGCTLYFLLTGRPPFARDSGDTQFNKMEAHLNLPIPSIHGIRLEVPPALESVVARLLAKEPDQRFESMAAVVEALGPFAGELDSLATPVQRQRPSKHSRALWPTATVAFLAIVAVTIAVLWQPLFHRKKPPDPTIDPPTIVKVKPEAGRLPMSAEDAKALQSQWADYLGRPVVERNAAGMDLVLIPPGEFEIDRITQLVQSRPHDLGQTEVTVGQFRQFVLATEYVTAAEKDGGGYAYSKDQKQFELIRDGASWQTPGPYVPEENFAVNLVSWDDANRFCDWLTKTEKRKYRLPTEWEWQWACRAGSEHRYVFGSRAADLDRGAWHQGNSSGTPRRSVASLQPNAWGLYDTVGNLYEWALNFNTTLTSQRYVDYRGEAKGRSHTVCGGAFDHVSPTWATKLTFTPNFRSPRIGFRVLREIRSPGDIVGE